MTNSSLYCILKYGNNKMTKTELYFGRTIGITGYVTDEQWNDFVNDYISTKFPAGFSIIEVIGRWRDIKTNKTIQEKTKMVIICHHKTKLDNKQIYNIILAYKKLFKQESVMRIDYEIDVQF